LNTTLRYPTSAGAPRRAKRHRKSGYFPLWGSQRDWLRQRRGRLQRRFQCRAMRAACAAVQQVQQQRCCKAIRATAASCTLLEHGDVADRNENLCLIPARSYYFRKRQECGRKYCCGVNLGHFGNRFFCVLYGHF